MPSFWSIAAQNSNLKYETPHIYRVVCGLVIDFVGIRDSAFILFCLSRASEFVISESWLAIKHVSRLTGSLRILASHNNRLAGDLVSRLFGSLSP